MSNTISLSLLNDDQKIKLPRKEEAPVSASEKLVREEIRKLSENSEEIRKLKKEIERHDEDNNKT